MWVLERRDLTRDARFYVLVTEPNLLGNTAVLRQWDQMATAAQECGSLLQSEPSGREALDKWLRRKSKRDRASL